MIAPPLGARVWLAAGITDMRNYAERTIMQSARPTELRPALFSTV
jgi:epoxyqueuosine reductase QueG